MKLWLNVGCGESDNPPLKIGEEIVWERLDAGENARADIKHDIRCPFPDQMHEHYDGIFMSHVLEHISYRETLPALSNVVECLKPGGHLVVYVPDLEWVASQILRGEWDLGLMAMMYGGHMDDWDFHRSGYTMNVARYVLERVGLTVTHTETSAFEIIIEGKPHNEFKQLILVAQK